MDEGSDESNFIKKLYSNFKTAQTKLNIKYDLKVNVIDIKKGNLIAQIRPFRFPPAPTKTIRTQVQEQV